MPAGNLLASDKEQNPHYITVKNSRDLQAYFRYAPDAEKAALARRILAKAAEFGVHVQSPTIRIWAEKP